MNVSYRWLKDLVPGLTLGPDEVARHLALRGAPVEDMVSPGAQLADVVVGRVLTAGQHPNADRLSLCTVDGGSGVVQVVCGAPNVKAGSWYPFAPVGAVLPGDFKLKKSKIRGEFSEGMLCSARELGLGVDHDGILEIFGDFTPGESFVRAMGLDDVTLDVETTTNRGDLLSHVGIARELAAEGPGGLTLPPIPGGSEPALSWTRHESEAVTPSARIRIEDGDLCSRYLGVVIRGVTVGPSPAWLQERLRGAGARPINNVVDATNYVLLELGQPLHAFDLAKLKEGTVVVRRAAATERDFVTLDGENRKITPDMLMICDPGGPVAIAGVMGGLDSEVDDDTTDVLLECALFDPKSIRATRRALNMSTDASYRFERGVDPDGMQAAALRAVAVILSTAGGAADPQALDVCPGAFTPAVVPLRLSRIRHLLGVDLDASTVRDYLSPLGFRVVGEGDGVLQVEVPGFRSYDVTREVDLIEEVARTHGYDRFPQDLRAYRPGTVPDHPLFRLEDDLRRHLAAEGFLETQTPAFVPEGEGDVRVSNPLNNREPFVRATLLPSLLRRLEHNFSRGARDIRLFEVGTSFRKDPEGGVPVEETHLAVVFTGRREPPHWSVPDQLYSVWDLKSLLEEVVSRAFPADARVVPAAGPSEVFVQDLSFVVVRGADGAESGSAGRVQDTRVDAPVWADDVWGMELTLPSPAPAAVVPVHQPLPLYPGVERDLALLVPLGVAAATVQDTIRQAAGPLLEAVSIFDHYRGEGMAPGVRSLAYRLRFRAPERTLKDKEVDRSVEGIVGRLKEELGVERRG
jgi:phenylalanyl-tRNA synthetase beta chain